MDVVMMPRAEYERGAYARPWPELFAAARSGEAGMAVIHEYVERYTEPKTGEKKERVMAIVPNEIGSPKCDEKYAVPPDVAMFYDHPRLGTALRFMNWKAS